MIDHLAHDFVPLVDLTAPDLSPGTKVVADNPLPIGHGDVPRAIVLVLNTDLGLLEQAEANRGQKAKNEADWTQLHVAEVM